MSKKKIMSMVITIGREFGSGGREIGVNLAHHLNVPFYDKEIITEAANAGSLAPEIIAKYEETPTSNPVVIKGRNLYAHYNQPITDQIFQAQSEVIRKIAEKGPCVIVGRCSDYVLQGKSINVFVHATLPARIERKRNMNIEVPNDKLEQHIKNIDKIRKRYYEHYTGEKWEQAMLSHHICIDTTHANLYGCVDAITQYIYAFQSNK